MRGPRVRRIRQAAAAAPDGPVSPELRRLINDPVLWGTLHAFTLALLATVWNMTTKPGDAQAGWWCCWGLWWVREARFRSRGESSRTLRYSRPGHSRSYRRRASRSAASGNSRSKAVQAVRPACPIASTMRKCACRLASGDRAASAVSTS